MSHPTTVRPRSHRGARNVLSLVMLASVITNIAITSQASAPAVSIALTAVILLAGGGLVMTRRDDHPR